LTDAFDKRFSGSPPWKTVFACPAVCRAKLLRSAGTLLCQTEPGSFLVAHNLRKVGSRGYIYTLTY
jgi:hypothetical protein